jgi:hypothetical protein
MLKFHPDHYTDLQKSGLSDETITAGGFESIPLRLIRKKLGFDFPDLNSMYEIPYQGCEGFSRFRCFPVEGKMVAKYFQPKDSGNHLYIPAVVASMLSNPTTPLYLTEGEKKALKGCQEGLACVAIGGLWNYRDKEGGLISDFDKIAWTGRAVSIVPDNDYLLPNVHGYEKNLKEAVQGLAYALIDKGAKVSIIELPEGPAKGLDDYLLTHSITEFLALPSKLVRKLTLEEAVAEATLYSLDGVLKRISKIPFAAKQEALVAELSRLLKISKTALKKDLKRFGTKFEGDQGDQKGKPMIALFPALVDLVDDDGKAVFLVTDTGGLRIETVADLDGAQFVPPSKEHLPFLLPRAEQCLAYYQTDDRELFNDLLAYLRRFSFLPAEQWTVIGLYVLSTYLQDHPDIHYQAMILFHAVPERGKSRTGKAIANAAYRGVHLVDMRETNIFRYSGNLGATIFFDIMDLWKKAERNGSEDVLLLRYEKGAKVSRVLYPEKGAFEDTVFYSIHGPTLMASNSDVHKILGSRCLTFSMPNAPGNYENPTPELAQDIKERLVAWRGKMMGRQLPDLMPIDGITGRLWDITKPLFQICQLVCPERFDVLVAAILDIAGQRVQEKKESFDGLLVQVIFEMTQGDADHFDIPTADVTTRFNELWVSDKPKSKEWTGRRLKALGVKTDTKNRFSIIRFDRVALNTLLAQYGFPVCEITSKTSNTLQDTDNYDASSFEVPCKDLFTHENLERTSNPVLAVNIDSCNDVEDIKDIPGVFGKVAEKASLKEVRI